MRSCRLMVVGLVLCGCPGDPEEGAGSAESDGDSTTDDATNTNTNTETNTNTNSETNTQASESQSSSDTTDSGVSVTVTDTTGDPTSETLDDSGTSTATDPTTDGSATTTTAEASASSDESSTTEPACDEPHEPNDAEATPSPLAEIACDGQADVDSVADDATGPDWFQFHGAYNDGCGTGTEDDALPRAQSSDNLPVCVFVTCIDGTGVDCLQGMETTSPGGLAGCCGDGDAQASVNCPGGSDESTDVLVSVDTTGTDCLEYTLQLGF